MLEFFIACIFIGLEYLHNNNIIQRDIKPENLVLDDKGYVRITDLGIARILKTENSADTSGTPGYMGIIMNHLFFLFSSRSDVSIKPYIRCGLFCFGSHCL